MFHQAPSDTNPSGVGLGLYIVKRFVDLLGGRISATSRLGDGSIFRLSLPAGVVAQPVSFEEHRAAQDRVTQVVDCRAAGRWASASDLKTAVLTTRHQWSPPGAETVYRARGAMPDRYRGAVEIREAALAAR